jgi:hypothetical protein
MRLLLGIILGGLLTVGAAYLYDSHNAIVASTTTGTTGGPAATAPRPLVNWDVVDRKWGHLTDRAHAAWVRIAG